MSGTSKEQEELSYAVMDVTSEIAGALMRVERANYVPQTDGRRETTAEHSFHLALIACLILPYFPDLDDASVLKYSILHDIAEARTGDVSVYASADERKRHREAEAGALSGLRELGRLISETIITPTESYMERQSREARFVYSLDKIVPYFLVLAGSGHHANPTQEQYLTTERRARDQIGSTFPELLPLFEYAAEGVRERVRP